MIIRPDEVQDYGVIHHDFTGQRVPDILVESKKSHPSNRTVYLIGGTYWHSSITIKNASRVVIRDATFFGEQTYAIKATCGVQQVERVEISNCRMDGVGTAIALEAEALTDQRSFARWRIRDVTADRVGTVMDFFRASFYHSIIDGLSGNLDEGCTHILFALHSKFNGTSISNVGFEGVPKDVELFNLLKSESNFQESNIKLIRKDYR